MADFSTFITDYCFFLFAGCFFFGEDLEGSLFLKGLGGPEASKN